MYIFKNSSMIDLQKKRTSTKKIKSNKSQALLEMPLAPLIEQINQLKSELATIKSKKNLKSIKNLEDGNERQTKVLYSEFLSPKADSKLDKTAQKLTTQGKSKQTLREIIFPIREYELKMNIELNKIYQLIKEGNETKSISSLNKFIAYLNTSIRDLETENRNVQIPGDEQVYHSRQREQIKIYQQLNNELEKQNVELKHALAKQIDQVEELQCFNSEMREQYDLVGRNLNDAQEQIEKMRIVCGGLRQQRRELEEKLKVFQRSIQKKQSEIFLYEEDLSFIKMESEKVKIQKRQIQKLFEGLQKQYRELKSKYDIEIEALTKEKNKWKNECESKRLTEKEAMGQEQQKIQLKKQIQLLRKECSGLTEELGQTKQKLCEEQKKILGYEQKMFKLETENDKLQRSVQFCKSEMRELAEEVNQVREQSKRYQSMALKSKLAPKSSDKAQTLQQIQQLIRLHRRNEQTE